MRQTGGCEIDGQGRGVEDGQRDGEVRAGSGADTEAQRDRTLAETWAQEIRRRGELEESSPDGMDLDTPHRFLTYIQ